jgi:hypothetical protein
MTSLHHFCKRDKGICDYEILKKILEINRELPLVQNNLGESPLHQLVAQNYPDSKVIVSILTACPMACRQAIPRCGKFPLHVIISNSRLTSKRNNLEAAILIMDGYPEAAVIEVFEDCSHLQRGGEICGDRNQRKWLPFFRAKEEMPQVNSLVLSSAIASYISHSYVLIGVPRTLLSWRRGLSARTFFRALPLQEVINLT